MFFNLRSVTDLYIAFDDLCYAVAEVNQSPTVNVFNGGDWKFRMGMATGFHLPSRPPTWFAPADIAAQAAKTDYFHGSPTVAIAFKPTFNRRDDNAWWLGCGLSIVAVRMAYVATRPMRLLVFFDPPSHKHQNTEDGTIVGPKWQLRAGTFADGGHVWPTYPEDVFGAQAKQQFWVRVRTGLRACEADLLGVQPLCRHAQKLQGQAFARISTIEHCDVAFLNGQNDFHGDIYVVGQTPQDFHTPYKALFDDLVSVCFLFSPCPMRRAALLMVVHSHTAGSRPNAPSLPHNQLGRSWRL